MGVNTAPVFPLQKVKIILPRLALHVQAAAEAVHFAAVHQLPEQAAVQPGLGHLRRSKRAVRLFSFTHYIIQN